VFDSIKVHKPKHGIVINGVPKIEIDLTQDHAAIISKLEEGNAHAHDIHITNITSLHQKVNTSLQSLHQSIVIFTEVAHATDRCIHGGIYINYLLFPAEHYSPQLNITQCFKCGDYGHRAFTANGNRNVGDVEMKSMQQRNVKVQNQRVSAAKGNMKSGTLNALSESESVGEWTN